MFNDSIFQDFPTFGAWYTNVYEPSLARKSGNPPHPKRASSPMAISNGGRSEELDYEEELDDKEAEDYIVETQPDLLEYYAPPTAASRQPDGPDAPWVRAFSVSEPETS